MNDISEEKLVQLREKILSMAREAELKDDPLAWFEELYNASCGNNTMIPWSDGEPHPFLVDWAKSNASVGRALVVGCGLGEDASYLAKIGWNVTAFDISPTAVEWSSRIHQGIDIDWRVEDLLHLPDTWIGAWDLVVEIHILQAIPEEIRQMAAPKLAPLLAPGGNLICIGRYNSSNQEAEGPPWPLSKPFIQSIGRGLNPVLFDVRNRKQDEPGVKRYIATWQRNN